MGIGLRLHFLSGFVQVLVDVRTFGDHFDLQLDRADLQIADEAVDDPQLLPAAPEQEVNGLHFEDLDIPPVRGIDDAVFILSTGR